MALQYAAGGDLYTFVSQHGRLDAETTAFIARQVLCGLRECHRIGVFHGDVKPENVLLPRRPGFHSGPPGPAVRLQYVAASATMNPGASRSVESENTAFNVSS